MHRFRAWAVAAALLSSAALAAAPEGPGPADLSSILQHVAAQVAQYYARARTLICTETVELQPIDSDWSPGGRPRRIVNELRVEWNPSDKDGPHARVRRRPLSVNGQSPEKAARRPDDACMDPKSVSPEPLEFLLAAHQHEYVFTWAGTDSVDGRDAVKIDYRPANADPPSVVWSGDCVSIEVPAQERGRVWIDRASGDVLRLDQHLAGRFDFNVPSDKRHNGGQTWMEIERADSSIRYKAITFHKPEETLVLPVAIDSLQIVRNAGVPRLRTHQELTGYRRFLTSGKLVPPPR